jgi:hypothetical protein
MVVILLPKLAERHVGCVDRSVRAAGDVGRFYWRPLCGCVAVRLLMYVSFPFLFSCSSSFFSNSLCHRTHPAMALCNTCKSIPFRAIDRLHNSDLKTKRAARLENVLWLDHWGEEPGDDYDNMTDSERSYSPFRPFVKHKSVQKIYDDAQKCLLCRIICLEPDITPGEEAQYDIAHLRHGFFNSSSMTGDSSGNEIIWIEFSMNDISIYHGNPAKPYIAYDMRGWRWRLTLWVRTVTGEFCEAHDGEKVLK